MDAQNADMSTALRFSSVHTDEIFTHGSYFSGWEHEFFQLSSGRFRGFSTEFWVGPLQIFLNQMDKSIEHRGSSWQGSRVFISLLPGAASASYSGRRQYEKTLATYRWDDVDRCTIDKPFASIGFCVSDAYWQTYLHKMSGGVDASRISMRVSRMSADAVLRLQRHLTDIIALGRAGGIAGLAGMADDVVMGLVLGEFVTQLVDEDGWDRWAAPSTREYIARKATDYIEANLLSSISIADICEMLHISPRTLEYAFKQCKGISPLKYILMRRLAEVRRQILSDARTQTVSASALQWGFSHFGRFAQMYKKSFDETPSKTRRRCLINAADA